jgi:hypothetical protein
MFERRRSTWDCGGFGESYYYYSHDCITVQSDNEPTRLLMTVPRDEDSYYKDRTFRLLETPAGEPLSFYAVRRNWDNAYCSEFIVEHWSNGEKREILAAFLGMGRGEQKLLLLGGRCVSSGNKRISG